MAFRRHITFLFRIKINALLSLAFHCPSCTCASFVAARKLLHICNFLSHLGTSTSLSFTHSVYRYCSIVFKYSPTQSMSSICLKLLSVVTIAGFFERQSYPTLSARLFTLRRHIPITPIHMQALCIFMPQVGSIRYQNNQAAGSSSK